ncbi:MAG TPA: hypothetical protein VGJ83_02005 [Gemmatimonadales bacterium]
MLPVVLVLSTCFLPQEPSTTQLIAFALPADTTLLAVGATMTPAVTVQGDGVWSSAPRIRFESRDTTVVVVDSAGRLTARRRGVATIHAVLASGATGATPPDTTFPVRVIISRLTLVKTADSLRSLGDTLLVRPGYLDADGWALDAADSAAISPIFELVSSGGAVTLDAVRGALVAKANGTDTVRARVDTSRINLVVTVRQRAVRVSAIPDPTTFRALTETRQFAATAWDRRDSLVAQAPVAWSSSNPGIVSVGPATGLATAVANGSVLVIAVVDSVADTTVATVSQVATQLAFTVQPGPAAAGSALAPAVQVAVRDSLGNIVASATSLVTLALGANPAGGTLGGTASRSVVGGVATFSDLIVDKAASGYTLTASAGGLAGATTVGFDVTPGPASQLAFNVSPPASPGTTTAGSPITPAVQVTVQDAFGNTVGTAGATITIAIGTNVGGGTLAGATTRTAVNGIATFSDVSIDKAGTGYTLTAAASGLAGAVSTPFNISSGLATRLAFAVQPTTTVAGRTIAPAVQVAVQDQFGNTVPAAAPQITLALAANPSGGVLAGSTTVSAVNGVAIFSDLSIAKTGGGYALIAATNGLAQATSAPFDVTPGPAVRLAFRVQPRPAAADSMIKPSVEVAVQDNLGNTVTTATNLITMALGANPAGGTLAGMVSRSAVAGVATFADLSIDKVGSGYTLVATAAGLAGSGSAGFDVTAAATRLAFSVQPSVTVAGQAISPGVQVTVQDAAGNTVTTASTVITMTMGANANGVRLSGTTVRSAVNGVATFADLSIDSVGSGYTLTATAAGLASAGSAAFDVTANAPAKLAFSVQPVTTPAGQGISPAVRVAVQDAFGNTVTAFTGNVSVAVTTGTGDPGATLGGATTVPASAGVATFTGLTLDKAASGYTLTAAASGLAGATSSAFSIVPGAAVKLAFIGQPGTTMAGAALSPTVRVAVLDAFGNTATAFTGSVTVAISGGTGNPNATLLGATTAPAALGVASFTDLSVDKAASGYSLTATASGLVGATSGAFSITPGIPARVTFTGQPRTAEAGSPLSPAVEVTVQDALGNVVTSATSSITLTITGGTGTAGATLAGTKTVSAVGGTALFSDISIAKAGTDYTLTATASGLTDASSTTFHITPGVAARLAFTGQPSTVQAGSALAPAARVAVQDALGNIVASSGTSVTVAITGGTGTPGATLSGTTTVTAGAGVAVLSTLSIDRAGTGYTLTAAAAGLAGATSAGFDVTVGAPNKLAFAGQPGATAAGSIMSPSVQVAVQDGLGNPDTTFAGTVTLAITSGTGSVGATLSGTLAATAARGVATFIDLSIDKAGSGYTFTAAATGLGGASSATFNITPGAAAKLTFSVQPATAIAGATLAPAVRVTAHDALGNTVAGYTGDVTVRLATGTGTAGAALSGNSTVVAVGGVALFSDLSIDRAGSGYALTAEAPGLTGATSAGFDIVVGAPAKLAFSVQPSAATAGTALTPGVQVTVQDALGNTVSSATTSVTVAIGANPGGGTLAGTVTKSAVNGVASFFDLSIDRAGTGYTLTAAASGLASATSTGFSITSSTTARLVFVVQPPSAAAGAPLAPAVRVAVQDASGNIVTGATTLITVAIGSNPGGATLAGTTQQNAVNGVATFPDLSLEKVGTGYTVTATASGVTGATSAGFAITPGAAARLGFTGQPSTTPARAAISPAVQVAIQDAYGNTVTGASAAVTVTVGTNPGAGILTGTLTNSTVNGVATFSDLSIDKTGTGYTLAAAASGLASAASAAFGITPGPAAQLIFTGQPSTTTAGVAVSPAVQVSVQDAYGNTVAGATTVVTVAIATNPGGGTLAGTLVQNAVNGIVTFPDLSIEKAGAGYTLAATASGLPVTTSASFNVNAGAAARLSFTAQPSSAVAGAAISPAVEVAIQDAFGNTVTSATTLITVALGSNPAGGTLMGMSSRNAANGVATFTDLSIDKATAGYALSAAASGLTSATSVTFGITPGAATQLAFTVQPRRTPKNTAITPAVQVTAQDAFGNTAPGFAGSVTVAIGTNPSIGTLGGTLTVAAVGGVATFSTLTIDKAGTGYTLTATSGGLASGTSGTFDITNPAVLAFVVQPTTTAVNAAITPPVQVAVQDGFGNIARGYSGSVILFLAGGTGGAQLRGTVTMTVVNGIATFTDLSVSRMGTGYRLTANDTAGILAVGTSVPFDIN